MISDERLDELKQRYQAATVQPDIPGGGGAYKALMEESRRAWTDILDALDELKRRRDEDYDRDPPRDRD